MFLLHVLLMDLIEGVGQMTENQRALGPREKHPTCSQTPLLARCPTAGFCKWRPELPGRRAERFLILWMQCSSEEPVNDVSAEQVLDSVEVLKREGGGKDGPQVGGPGL